MARAVLNTFNRYQAAEYNTAVNRAAMFRFNPGKVFPPKHPYPPKGCGKCEFTQLAHDPNNEQCRACRAIAQNLHGNTQHQRPSAELKKTVSNRYRTFAHTLPLVEIENGKMAYRKDIGIANGKTVRVGIDFFKENFNKAQYEITLEETIRIAMEFEQWMPQLSTYTTEPGRHHDCEFAVFQTTFEERRIEFKAMILDDVFKGWLLRLL